jgi:hypothetical protein
MNIEYHQAAHDPSCSSQSFGSVDLARQDLEILLANLNSFESMVKKSISRLREDILTTAVHLG